MCIRDRGREDVYFPERTSRFENLEQSRRYFRSRGMAMGETLERGGFTLSLIHI